ncbi:MAG: hypothetical protein ACI9LN_002797, partial [Saprospiraceae bacterium]
LFRAFLNTVNSPCLKLFVKNAVFAISSRGI